MLLLNQQQQCFLGHVGQNVGLFMVIIILLPWAMKHQFLSFLCIFCVFMIEAFTVFCYNRSTFGYIIGVLCLASGRNAGQWFPSCYGK